MDFEWDEEKNAQNIRKHGIDFERAKAIFRGPVLTMPDDREDYGELREISIGLVGGVAVIVVVHTDRDGVCRIISARPAQKHERKLYGEALRKGSVS